MAGRIDCYIDISSFYSYLAFYYLLTHEKELAAHGIDVEFHPVFAGAVQADNKPPWVVHQKKKYLDTYETVRAKITFGKPEIVAPDDLSELLDIGWTQKPMRALLFIKDNYPREVYHTAFHFLFHVFWTLPRRRVRDEPVLAQALADIPADFHGLGDYKASELLFSEDQVKEIIAAQNSTKYKEVLRTATKQLNDRGAFGVPWIIASNSKGKQEPYFGSDRFHHVFEFLGLPIQKFKLLPPGSNAGTPKL
ncbi:DSBA-like thioredoxin domain-containing protein [Thozetella sp. PMI_491]|nr:DSBA-like thioredoxin domain-containing protein [Thozetella sp. PMI_491]